MTFHKFNAILILELWALYTMKGALLWILEIHSVLVVGFGAKALKVQMEKSIVQIVTTRFGGNIPGNNHKLKISNAASYDL